jgi:hypothetical protein
VATPPVVGLGTLRRLAALELHSHAVLSVYLDFEQAAVAACEEGLLSLVGELPRPLRLFTISRVRETLHAVPTFAHGTRAVAMFFAADGSELAIVALPERVASMAVFETQPWLEPLVGMCRPGDRGEARGGPLPPRLGWPAHTVAPTIASDRVGVIAWR